MVVQSAGSSAIVDDCRKKYKKKYSCANTAQNRKMWQNTPLFSLFTKQCKNYSLHF